MALKESLFVRIAINSVTEAGSIMVSGFLLELKNMVEEGKIDEQDYIDAIKSGLSFFAILERLAENSTKKTDDKVVEMFYSPLKEFAEAEGI